MMRRILSVIREALRRYFIAGVLAFAPLAVTIWAIGAIIVWLDNLILPRVLKLVIPGLEEAPPVPVIGMLFTFFVIILMGVLARHLFGGELQRIWERMLGRVPIARSIYGGVKQLFEAILTTSTAQSSFSRVVLVEYPRRGIYGLAFVTGEVSGPLRHCFEERRMLNCFIPTTPNPTSGFYLLVPERELRVVDVTVEQAFKLIMSAGLVTPDEAGPATGGIPAGEVAPDYAAPGPSSGPAPEPSR
jgi:uncharacterized membrane protein